MKRVLDRTWMATIAIVGVASLYYVITVTGPYAPNTVPSWPAQYAAGLAVVAGSAAIVTPLSWWALAGWRKRSGRGAGSAAGALGGFCAYFVPLLLVLGEDPGSGNIAFPIAVLFKLAEALVLGGIGAVIGAILVRQASPQESGPCGSIP